jgi:hypothetical protein
MDSGGVPTLYLSSDQATTFHFFWQSPTPLRNAPPLQCKRSLSRRHSNVPESRRPPVHGRKAVETCLRCCSGAVRHAACPPYLLNTAFMSHLRAQIPSHHVFVPYAHMQLATWAVHAEGEE